MYVINAIKPVIINGRSYRPLAYIKVNTLIEKATATSLKG